jgi:cytochrome P450
LDLYGPNISTHKEKEWRFHRKIIARTFSPKNLNHVYHETKRQVSQMMESWEHKMEKGIMVSEKYPQHISANASLQTEMFRLALHVISDAGYGYSFEWESAGEVKNGHRLSFHESILITLENLFTLAAIPKPLLNLPIKKFQTAKTAWKEFGVYLQELVDLGRTRQEKSAQNDSLLNALVAANVGGDSKARRLSDDDIVGNSFFFLLAGHETT